MDLFDVAVQLGFLQESFTAVVTLVPVYPVVIVKVTLKLEFQPESFATDMTYVRILSCVYVGVELHPLLADKS